MNPFQSLRSYEDFIYDLPTTYPVVVYTTLVVIRHSAKQATVTGEVALTDAHRLVVSERLDFADQVVRIRHYGDEVCGRISIAKVNDSAGNVAYPF